MYIIAGLGNPEKQYDGTRHNVGFATIDCLSEKYGISLTEKKFRAVYGKGRIGEEKVILFNLSGHGLIDMTAYDQYLQGNLQNYDLTDEAIEKNLDEIKNL